MGLAAFMLAEEEAQRATEEAKTVKAVQEPEEEPVKPAATVVAKPRVKPPSTAT